MGDDPLIPQPLVHSDAVSGQGGSAATGGTNYTFHNGLSKDSQTLVVILSSFALCASICVLVVYLVGRASDRDRMNDKIADSEKRAIDRATIAEREARVAQDTITHFQIELAKKGIFISVDDH